MQLSERLALLHRLGAHLQTKDEYLEAIMARTHYHNKWFTIDNQKQAVQAIAERFLAPDALDAWLKAYPVPAVTPSPKRVGLVLAGNIPLVGFHDVLSVFVAGHKAQVKLSEKDQYLLPYFFKLLGQWDERAKDYFTIVPQLKVFDAIIATGSNNASRYFEAYFGKYPHIIRRNRNAVAVLTGEETEEELRALGADVFQYYGLGCRNVAKLYVPNGYDFTKLLEVFHEFKTMVLNDKYKNNFDYNYASIILNKVPHLNNGCIILLEDPALQSRIACLHYEQFESIAAVENDLTEKADEIQCIVAREGAVQQPSFSFGKAQEPELWDYADGVDTMKFLLSL
jgi:hypothetical protein